MVFHDIFWHYLHTWFSCECSNFIYQQVNLTAVVECYFFVGAC
uniref:Uncharacterized protein n=1 Tax=Meloidogyne enterolobii TaxID=390850 RepID=A0A6V7UPJ5_MELEN|nr:unnamed protein product [Meloidogyne enterolobii]